VVRLSGKADGTFGWPQEAGVGHGCKVLEGDGRTSVRAGEVRSFYL